VDFDGTIAQTVISRPSPAIIEGSIHPNAIDILREYMKCFHLVICSARCAKPAVVGAVAAFLIENGLSAQELKQITITNQKPPGLILDDWAVRFEGRFPSVEELKATRPWHGRGIVG